MRLWIASDNTHGQYYTIPDDDNLSPVEIAYKYGRAESGEIIHIWRGDNSDWFPDAEVYWDSQYREYRENK